MSTIFFTGFPGFLGSELLPRVLARAADRTAVCLVQPKFADLARHRAADLETAHPAARGRIRIVEGDIARADLGLAQRDAAQRDPAEIYHLAAIYDLGVGREAAMRVNVAGTRHVLDFAAGCRGLERVHYVSTCYVSGRYPGTFTEDDLECGQRFNNHYEETKYLAEVEVRRAMAGGLPATIYRPSVVVGDSRTGATQKYDGPYFVIQWLVRQWRLAVLPVVGDTRSTEFNMVPRDFVLDAMMHLSGLPQSLGRTYALADPHPLTVDEILSLLADAVGSHVVRVPLPLGVAKFSIEHVPGVYRVMRIPSTAIDYFVHPTHYDTRHATADLAGSGIAVPPLASYAERLVEFVRQHPSIGAAAMA